MIGYALKKLANENGMNIDHGMAYGEFCGYAVSFFEGSGWKEITVSCRFPDTQKKNELQETLTLANLRKMYRITDWTIKEKGIYVRFYDNPGTMKRIYAFLEWFFPLLDQSDATKAGICPHCGTQISNGTWQIVGDMAVYMHDSCINHLHRLEDDKAVIEKEEKASSYFKGTLGAIAGAMIGSVIWGAVFYFGYFASVIGVIIGIFASKGYDLANGKQTKKKNIILVVAAFVAVVTGILGAHCYDYANIILSGGLPGYRLEDVPSLLLDSLQDSAFLRNFLSNVGAGMVFALVGLRLIVRKVNKENKNFRPKELR